MNAPENKETEKKNVLMEIKRIRKELAAPALRSYERDELQNELIRLFARYTKLLNI